MNWIPLYNPPTIRVPQDITRQHWRAEAERCETELKEWLCVPHSHEVLLLDRCTTALEIGFRMLGRKLALIPNRTYRAARDAAFNAGYQVEILPVAHYSAWIADPGRDAVYVPTTLGGAKLKPYRFHEWLGGVITDCAHTCYPDMFKGIPMGDNTLFALSFFPTKPLGALGGGLLVAPRRPVRMWRSRVWPDGLRDQCMFLYPQTVQSWAIRDRMMAWSEERQRRLRVNCRAIAKVVTNRFDVQQVWTDLYTPHVLAFTGPGSSELVRRCKELNIETGDHYPRLFEQCGFSDQVSLPFWTDEVVERLEST